MLALKILPMTPPLVHIVQVTYPFYFEMSELVLKMSFLLICEPPYTLLASIMCVFTCRVSLQMQ